MHKSLWYILFGSLKVSLHSHLSIRCVCSQRSYESEKKKKVKVKVKVGEDPGEGQVFFILLGVEKLKHREYMYQSL